MMQDSRSQHKNRASAMNILRSRTVTPNASASTPRARPTTRRRSAPATEANASAPTISQGRVTDHRINLTLTNCVDLEALGELIEH
jgi:peptide chain release factor 1